MYNMAQEENNENQYNFNCIMCSDAHQISTMYGCNHGHFFCRACYKNSCSTGQCPSRYCDMMLEKANARGFIYHKETHLLANKIIPFPWEVSAHIKNLHKKDSVSSLSKSSASLMTLSKNCQTLEQNSSEKSIGKKTLRKNNFGKRPRKKAQRGKPDKKGPQNKFSLQRVPVCCPCQDCCKTIAVTGFEAHFKYEHKNIVIVDTRLDARNGMTFNPKFLHFGKQLCIVLIRIIEDFPRDSKSQYSIAYTSSKSCFGLAATKPVLVVMAARPARLATSQKANDYEDDESCDGRVYNSTNKLVIWVASNINTNYGYTVAVSGVDSYIRIKYVGPVLHVDESPAKVCGEGRGLILTENHVDALASNGSSSIVLDVIIHDEEDDNIQ